MLRLTELRNERRLSKAALARRAELDQSRLSKIEAGRDRPYDRELTRLALALGFPAERMKELLRPIVLGTEMPDNVVRCPQGVGNGGVGQ